MDKTKFNSFCYKSKFKEDYIAYYDENNKLVEHLSPREELIKRLEKGNYKREDDYQNGVIKEITFEPFPEEYEIKTKIDLDYEAFLLSQEGLSKLRNIIYPKEFEYKGFWFYDRFPVITEFGLSMIDKSKLTLSEVEDYLVKERIYYENSNIEICEVLMDMQFGKGVKTLSELF